MSNFFKALSRAKIPTRLRNRYSSLTIFGVVLVALLVSANGLAGGSQPVTAQTVCAGPAVCNPEVSATSRSPAAHTSYQVTFTTPEAIVPLTGRITMELHEDIRVPRSIFPTRVRVEYIHSAAGQPIQRAGGSANDVSLVSQGDPRRPTKINVVHGIRGSGERGAFLTIPSGARVTVTFQQGAGISNPTEGGAFSWKVGVGNGPLSDAVHPDRRVIQAFNAASPDVVTAGLLVDREIDLSHEEISRGESITVIARGYKNGHTLMVWRDADIDGVHDPEESELCQVEIDRNDIGYCNFLVHLPPFSSGFGECSGVAVLNCNIVNALDGMGQSSVIFRDITTQITEVDQALELVGSIVVDEVPGPGGNLQVELVDFPTGVITAVTIGGALADTGQLRVWPPGRLYLSVPVPNDVRVGHQYLRVAMYRTSNECEGNSGNMPECNWFKEVLVNLSQPEATLRIFPRAVVPNQRVSLSGLGFSRIEGTTIDEVQFSNSVLDPSRVNEGVGSIAVASDGRWAGSVDLPIIEATATEGAHILRARDSAGRTSSVEVSVLPREVRVTPIWGRPGTTVTVKGTGFPSRNAHGSSVNLRIYYESGDAFTVVSAEPDINGNFTQEIQIPLNTPAPSSNTVRVEFDDDNGSPVITNTPHEVPGAEVRLFPKSGPPGSSVTVIGKGFRHHVPLAKLNFGEIDVSPAHSVSTDANGEFTVLLLIPSLAFGQQTVQVAVAGTTAVATFDITPSDAAPGPPKRVAEALEVLDYRLLRVFHFNNDAKVWNFYSPVVPESSTLNFMVQGETYLILVTEPVQVILNGKQRNLTCRRGNCWNQIVW